MFLLPVPPARAGSFFKLCEMKHLQEHKDRILRKKEQRDFLARNYHIRSLFAWLLYPLAVVVSLATGGVFLIDWLARTTDHPIASVVIGLVLAAGIEVGKYVIGSGTMQDIFDRTWQHGTHHLVFFALKALTCALIFATSAWISIGGAPMSASFFVRTTQTPTPPDLDAVARPFDEAIARQEVLIADARKMTWRGRIVREGRNIISRAQGEIARIERERQAALEAARSAHEQALANMAHTATVSGTWLTRFAGLGEVLGLLILFVLAAYEHGVYLDHNQSEETPPRGPQLAISTGGTQPLAVAKKEIGFRVSKPETPETESLKHFETTKFQLETSETETAETRLVSVLTAEEIDARVRELRRRIKSYEWKLRNGVGRPETARRNIERLRAEIDQLKSKSA